MPQPMLITTKEASRELGYTIQHTRLLIRTGKLKALKFGRDWLIERGDLQSQIHKLLHNSTAGRTEG